jgi:hypothetical protein
MSLIRTGVLIAVAIAAMPSDKGEQQRLYLKAVSAIDWAVTYCDRNPVHCANAGEYWVVFKDKAQFAGELALNAAKRYMTAEGAAERSPVKTSLSARRGTLTPDDMKPEWRGSTRGI